MKLRNLLEEVLRSGQSKEYRSYRVREYLASKVLCIANWIFPEGFEE